MICGDYYAGGFHGVLLRDESTLGRLWPAITTLLQRIEVQEGLSREHDFILIKDIPGSATLETRLLRPQSVSPGGFFAQHGTAPFAALEAV